MARVYLDTNIYIDILKRNKNIAYQLKNHLLYISPLSLHIFYYAYKIKVPNKSINKKVNTFSVVPLTEGLLTKALIGPTKDLEDNIQLHSAAEAECNYFLTSDKNLFKMKFFGRCEITNTLIN